MKIIEVKAGERKRIIRRLSSSVKASYQFAAEPLVEGVPLSGNVEICGSHWVFPKAPIFQKLQTENTVEKGMWDTIYSVYVTPEQDIKIAILDAKLRYVGVYVAIVIMLIAVALVFLTMTPS